MRGVMVDHWLASFMGTERKEDTILVDFLGLKAHSNLLTSIYQVGAPSICKVYATRDAISWTAVPLIKQVIIEASDNPLNTLRRFYKLARLLIGDRRQIFITGATTPWHVFVAIFGSPSRISLLSHNEFMKIESGAGYSSGILRIIFGIYRKRGFRVAVMSSVMRRNILERKLYSERLLHVFLHPLPKLDPHLRFSVNGSVNLLGFLRPQKLNGAAELIAELKMVHRKRVRVFGKVSNTACLVPLLGYCDDVTLVTQSYTATEETEFLSSEPISAIIFCPNDRYELLTPGTVMDCIRLGCYCLSPVASPIAAELVGDLAITDIGEASTDPRAMIESLIQERFLLNKQQFLKLVGTQV